LQYTALFFICPYWGHIMPVLSIAKRLKEYGHRIIFYTTEKYRHVFSGTGIIIENYRYIEHLQLHLNYINDNTSQLATLLAAYGRRFEEQEILVEYAAEEMKKYKPNYIVYDYCDAYWAKAAAEKMQIIHIASVPTFAIHPNMIDVAPEMCMKYILSLNEKEKNFPHLNGKTFIRHLNCIIRKKYNVPRFDIMDYGNSQYLNLIHTSSAFQPFSNIFPVHFKFIGIDANRHPAVTNKSMFVKTNKIIIYVSMGTVADTNCVEIYQKCIVAYKNTSYQVVMSIGQIPPEELGDIPDNITIYPFVPQGEILKVANVFVTNGGMNSVNEALLGGVPMILVPRVSDQHIVARQVFENGGGLILPYDFTIKMLKDSTIELLKNNYLKSCQTMGDTLRRAGGGETGTKEIIMLVQ